MELGFQGEAVVLRRPVAGFSLIEALIAAGVLGMIAIGVLPLFTQALLNNKQGSDSTTVTTFGKTELEALDAADFGSSQLTIQPGTTSTVTTDWYVQQSTSQIGGTNFFLWTTTPPTSAMGLTLWQRTTTVQQYGYADLNFATALDGNTIADFVAFKRIVVVVQRPPGMPGASALSGGKSVTLQLVRSQ
jgi:Tfp pilus assembly protein PilV